MGFSADRLLGVLRQFPPIRSYRVAYSGGLDSQVLLHSLVQLRPQLPGTALSAIHVDHGLSPQSGQWSQYCRQTCAELGVDCKVVKVNAFPDKGESPEAAAREARYAALRAWLEEGECLLTAQHQDDQAETMLLQLLRGAGPQGLAAMARIMPFGRGILLRPLLVFSRTELKAYADQKGLAWIEDPSNFNLGFDRNYLRHEILPLLRRRWPSLSRTLSRAALHQADAAWLLDRQAREELAAVSADEPALSVPALQGLAPPQQRNLLRHWVKRQGLPPPDSARLQQILEEVLPASEDAQPLVVWPGAEVRRYRNRLYAQSPLPFHDVTKMLAWDGSEPLVLPPAVGGVLVSKLTQGFGLAAEWLRLNPVTVRFRQGGERIHLVDRSYSCTLKKLFQEQAVPPWRRARIPMIYVADKLAFVVGMGVARDFAAGPGQEGVVFEWLL